MQNLGDGYYQFNWTTPKSYANSCKTMYLDLAASPAALSNAEITAKLSAGLIASATFQFKK